MWKDPRLWWTARSGSRGDLIVKDQLQRCAPRLHGSTPGSPTVRQLRCCGTVFQTGPAEEKREVETERERERERGKKANGGQEEENVTTAGCGQSVCGWLHCLWGGLGSCTCPSPSPRPGAVWTRATLLYLSGRAHSGGGAHTLSHTLSHTHTDGTVRTHSYTGQEGNMTSSYNLDFLPDMMVESRLLVPGDRMWVIRLFFSSASGVWVRVSVYAVLKSSCPMWKCCSATWCVTRIGVRMKAGARVTVSVCYCVSYGLLLLISVDKLCGDRRSARGCYQL